MLGLQERVAYGADDVFDHFVVWGETEGEGDGGGPGGGEFSRCANYTVSVCEGRRGVYE